MIDMLSEGGRDALRLFTNLPWLLWILTVPSVYGLLCGSPGSTVLNLCKSQTHLLIEGENSYIEASGMWSNTPCACHVTSNTTDRQMAYLVISLNLTSDPGITHGPTPGQISCNGLTRIYEQRVIRKDLLCYQGVTEFVASPRQDVIYSIEHGRPDDTAQEVRPICITLKPTSLGNGYVKIICDEKTEVTTTTSISTSTTEAITTSSTTERLTTPTTTITQPTTTRSTAAPTTQTSTAPHIATNSTTTTTPSTAVTAATATSAAPTSTDTSTTTTTVAPTITLITATPTITTTDAPTTSPTDAPTVTTPDAPIPTATTATSITHTDVHTTTPFTTAPTAIITNASTTTTTAAPITAITTAAPTSNITSSAPTNLTTSAVSTIPTSTAASTTPTTTTAPTHPTATVAPTTPTTTVAPTTPTTTVAPTTPTTTVAPTTPTTTVAPTTPTTTTAPTHPTATVAPATPTTTVAPTTPTTTVAPTTPTTTVAPTTPSTTAAPTNPTTTPAPTNPTTTAVPTTPTSTAALTSRTTTAAPTTPATTTVPTTPTTTVAPTTPPTTAAPTPPTTTPAPTTTATTAAATNPTTTVAPTTPSTTTSASTTPTTTATTATSTSTTTNTSTASFTTTITTDAPSTTTPTITPTITPRTPYQTSTAKPNTSSSTDGPITATSKTFPPRSSRQPSSTATQTTQTTSYTNLSDGTTDGSGGEVGTVTTLIPKSDTVVIQDDRLPLILGLSVAGGLILIVITILTVFICCRVRRATKAGRYLSRDAESNTQNPNGDREKRVRFKIYTRANGHAVNGVANHRKPDQPGVSVTSHVNGKTSEGQLNGRKSGGVKSIERFLGIDDRDSRKHRNGTPDSALKNVKSILKNNGKHSDSNGGSYESDDPFDKNNIYQYRNQLTDNSTCLNGHDRDTNLYTQAIVSLPRSALSVSHLKPVGTASKPSYTVGMGRGIDNISSPAKRELEWTTAYRETLTPNSDAHGPPNKASTIMDPKMWMPPITKDNRENRKLNMKIFRYERIKNMKLAKEHQNPNELIVSTELNDWINSNVAKKVSFGRLNTVRETNNNVRL